MDLKAINTKLERLEAVIGRMIIDAHDHGYENSYNKTFNTGRYSGESTNATEIMANDIVHDADAITMEHYEEEARVNRLKEDEKYRNWKRRDAVKSGFITACSFCGKGEKEIRQALADGEKDAKMKLIVGKGLGVDVYICRECVKTCNEIFTENND